MKRCGGLILLCLGLGACSSNNPYVAASKPMPPAPAQAANTSDSNVTNTNKMTISGSNSHAETHKQNVHTEDPRDKEPRQFQLHAIQEQWHHGAARDVISAPRHDIAA